MANIYKMCFFAIITTASVTLDFNKQTFNAELIQKCLLIHFVCILYDYILIVAPSYIQNKKLHSNIHIIIHWPHL